MGLDQIDAGGIKLGSVISALHGEHLSFFARCPKRFSFSIATAADAAKDSPYFVALGEGFTKRHDQ